MYDARLFEFIKKARGEGQTDTQIQERLKNSGWSNQAIADAFGGKLPYDPNSTKPRAKGVRLFKNIILLIGGFGAIVLALLVALIPLVLFSLNAARAQARDTRRISDISLLRNAINAFHIQYGTYPEGQGPLSTGVLDVLITEHMLEKIPTDPGEYFYFYCSDPNRHSFVLGATLEQENLSILYVDLDGDQYCQSETHQCDDPALCVGPK